MKLFDTLLLSMGVAFIIIGMYEVMTAGLGSAYIFIMTSIGAFLWFTYRKKSKA